MLPVMAARVSLSPPRGTAVRSACRDKGFTVDYNKGDNYYRANNDAGWQVSIDYEGNQIMSIRIDAPDTSSGSTTSEPSPDSSTVEIFFCPEKDRRDQKSKSAPF